ncbi:Uncharacterised protein [Mycolicibacterium smegmatis]|nr:Uncharacterised protein [Mycolicibacterium smegmatis]
MRKSQLKLRALLDAYRSWNRYAYLSSHERRLNRSLWAALGFFVVYTVLQHVVFAKVRPIFHMGAQWGDLLYDLGIAYIGAFVFYLLVVRLPLRRDRQNVYENLSPLVNQIVAEAVTLMGLLNGAAGAPTGRRCTAENVAETCSLISLNTQVKMKIVNSDGSERPATVRDALLRSSEKSRKLNRELLEFSGHLSSELINYIIAIEQRGYFVMFSQFDSIIVKLTPQENVSFLWRYIFDYLQLVEQVNRYYHEYFKAFEFRGDFLIAGTDKTSHAVPLADRMSG